MVMVVMLGRDGLRLASALMEAFDGDKEGDGKFWNESTVGIRSEVGYKTIIK